MDRRHLLKAFAALAIAPPARSRSDASWAELQAGGVAILLRHARTEPGLGDPTGFRLGDCSTQRNLSEEGRQQAIRIGEALAARRVRVDRVLSSEWCRCLDTARLAFPRLEVERFPALNSFFADGAGEPAQTREAMARVARIGAPANVAMVTHHVNILALTGEVAGSGEAILARASGASLRVVGRLAL
jgi:phosphohistidine phosphatase SixA